MARLIQDIKPVKSTSLINARAIQDRALKVHQATNIPKLAERSRQKIWYMYPSEKLSHGL
jgi:hypothetical protein